MSKIWIIRQSYGKTIIVDKEVALLSKIHDGMGANIEEYELLSSVSVPDFLKARERDAQLKGILGELDKNQLAIQEFISLFDKIAEDVERTSRWGGKIESEKQLKLKQLKKFQLETTKFKAYIKKEIKYFTHVSLEQEWFIAILKVYNFRIISYGQRYSSGKYINIGPPDDIQKAFEEAKKVMRKKK